MHGGEEQARAIIVYIATTQYTHSGRCTCGNQTTAVIQDRTKQDRTRQDKKMRWDAAITLATPGTACLFRQCQLVS
jgi:hypothetical protein